jgi:hypothetical protein
MPLVLSFQKSFSFIDLDGDFLTKKAPISGLVVVFSLMVSFTHYLTQAPVQELPKIKKVKKCVSVNHN